MVTGAVDTGPVFVCNPKRSKMSRLLHQPKYHACVYKFQLVCSFLGHIISYSGLHDGVEPDSNIWQQTSQDHKMEPGELLLADGIYIGAGCEQLLVKYDKEQTKSTAHQDINDIIDLHRGGIDREVHTRMQQGV